MTDAEYAAWYNSLAPSSRAFAHAPGSAGYSNANQQAKISDAQFAAQGISDPWGYAIAGGAKSAPAPGVAQTPYSIQPAPAPVPQTPTTGGVNVQPPPPAPTLSAPQVGGEQVQPAPTAPSNTGAPTGYSNPTTQPASVPQVFNKSLFGQPNTRAPGSSGPVVQAMMRRTKQPWETY